MNYDLTVSLSEQTWQLLQQRAAATGAHPERIVEAAVQEHLAPHPGAATRLKSELTPEETRQASERLYKSFGAVNLGYPTGTDNESIDADLEREYGDNHEPK